MDAYEVNQRLRALWETQARPVSGDTLNKVLPEVPVYVLTEGKLKLIRDVYLDDRKIILSTANDTP